MCQAQQQIQSMMKGLLATAQANANTSQAKIGSLKHLYETLQNETDILSKGYEEVCIITLNNPE